MRAYFCVCVCEYVYIYEKLKSTNVTMMTAIKDVALELHSTGLLRRIFLGTRSRVQAVHTHAIQSQQFFHPFFTSTFSSSSSNDDDDRQTLMKPGTMIITNFSSPGSFGILFDCALETTTSSQLYKFVRTLPSPTHTHTYAHIHKHIYTYRVQLEIADD